MSFADKLKQMQETILAERGTVITYQQRDIVIENIPAVPTKSGLENEKSGDHRVRYDRREYIVQFDLLQWQGQQIVPKPGDYIVEGDDVYEVLSAKPKECYYPVDSNGLYVRIYTQRKSKKKG